MGNHFLWNDKLHAKGRTKYLKVATPSSWSQKDWSENNKIKRALFTGWPIPLLIIK